MNEAPKNADTSNVLSFVIKQAKPEDAEAICSLLRETWLDTYPNAEAAITREDIRLRIEGRQGERIQPNIER
jgi:hypothetical protein